MKASRPARVRCAENVLRVKSCLRYDFWTEVSQDMRWATQLTKHHWFLLPAFGAILLLAFGCGSSGQPGAPTQSHMASPDAPAQVSGQPATTRSGLQYWDLVTGTGDTAVPGKPVSVHYTGWLTNGKKFDSSLDRGNPFIFTLGARQVIQGWDEGVAGMKVGGKRQLRIPPSLGYGDAGAGGVIPGGATLIFDVELTGVGK
jgi:peptidylprolyl isomerase